MGKGQKREIHNMCNNGDKKIIIITITVNSKWWLEENRGVK